jgi:hypothetical protein
MSQIQLVELYTELAKLSATEAMDVTETETRLVLERLFHELGDLPSTQSITVLVDFLGVNDSKQNLKEFLDEVSEELDTADTRRYAAGYITRVESLISQRDAKRIPPNDHITSPRFLVYARDGERFMH